MIESAIRAIVEFLDCVRLCRIYDIAASLAKGQALQRHPFSGERCRRGALTHLLSGSSDHRTEIHLATRAAAAATFDQPGRSVGRLAR
jgi:hypothetical protein